MIQPLNLKFLYKMTSFVYILSKNILFVNRIVIFANNNAKIKIERGFIMQVRTDLALEAKEIAGETSSGVEVQEEQFKNMKVTKIDITSRQGAEEIGKEMGTYVTIELPTLTDDFKDTDERLIKMGELICELLPEEGLVLVAGLGNVNITPDALGPKSAQGVLATRHIKGELAESVGLDALRSVAVIAPGVLGQTGVETGELIFSIAEKIKPSAIIAIDALASRRLERLGCTVQISNTGISPGAGVRNQRTKINQETTGVPVIGIGIPTVVDALTLANDLLADTKPASTDTEIRRSVCPKGEMMVVTPREIDLLVMRGAKLISMAVNAALHREFEISDLISLVN